MKRVFVVCQLREGSNFCMSFFYFFDKIRDFIGRKEILQAKGGTRSPPYL